MSRRAPAAAQSAMNRTVRIAAPGAPPELATAPIPDLGPGELQVRMAAAAMNFADLLMIEGRYQDTPPFPFVAGMEGAGVVAAAGPGATLAPGTRVAVSGRGTFADHAAREASASIARLVP